MEAIKEFIQEIGGTIAIEFFDLQMESRICGSSDSYVPFKLAVKRLNITCVEDQPIACRRVYRRRFLEIICFLKPRNSRPLS